MKNIVFVLVVEDDPVLLINAQDTLEGGGFGVLDAMNAEEAFKVLNLEVNLISCLVTDVRINSALTGWDVARHARKANPKIPVVYTTGESENDWLIYGVPNSIILSKPFAPAQLISAVTKLMNV